MRESSSVHQAYEHSAGSPDLPLQSRLQGGQFLASVYIATPLFKKKKKLQKPSCAPDTLPRCQEWNLLMELTFLGQSIRENPLQ